MHTNLTIKLTPLKTFWNNRASFSKKKFEKCEIQDNYNFLREFTKLCYNERQRGVFVRKKALLGIIHLVRFL